MAVYIADGSKEEVVVRVTDDTGQITNLAPLSPQFELIRDSNDALVQSGSASASAMNLYCLIDSTLANILAGEKYRLYVSFTIAAGNVPRLGPMEVFVVE
jgi:hypothetical protein